MDAADARTPPGKPCKRRLRSAFQAYGYGVPDTERARRSASNALALIVQDTIKPFRKGATNSADHVHNEMKLFVAHRGSAGVGEHTGDTNGGVEHLYSTKSVRAGPRIEVPFASHNLRFKLNRPNERRAAFIARISKAAEETDEPVVEEDDGWTFGRNRRDVGSVHVDELTCRASDLARRNILAVHPVSGWWKLKTTPNPEEKSARFALVIEIDASEVDVDLYAEVQTAIENMAAIPV